MLPPSLNKSTHFVRHEQSLHGTKWKKSLNLRVVIRKTLNTVDVSLGAFGNNNSCTAENNFTFVWNQDL